MVKEPTISIRSSCRGGIGIAVTRGQHRINHARGELVSILEPCLPGCGFASRGIDLLIRRIGIEIAAEQMRAMSIAMWL